MRLLGCSAGAWLAALLLVGGAAPARADAPPDPLRLVPKEADLVVEVPQPRRLVEAFTTLDVLKQLGQFDQLPDLVELDHLPALLPARRLLREAIRPQMAGA